MKQVWEKIVEGILTCSGFITSITIVLIVIFLFTEAFGLFGNKVTEEGYVLAVNGKNPVRELSAVQIKDVFDEEITNWEVPISELRYSGWKILLLIFRKKSWGRNTTRRENVSVR